MNIQSLVRFALATAALSAPALKAATFSYNVSINTSALMSAPNAPYALDFILNDGSTDASNQVSLSNFLITGGSVDAASIFTAGKASGNLTGGVTLVDGNASNGGVAEFSENFSAATSLISFTVTTTQNFQSLKDSLSVQIFDNVAGNFLTTNGNGGFTLLDQDIGFQDTTANVQTYSSTSPAGVTASVSAVPEPSTYGLLGAGALAAASFVRRRRAKRA